MQNEKKNKHMTLEDRIEIRECLQTFAPCAACS